MSDDNLFGDDNSVGDITTEEEALAAVRQDGGALRYVPDELKTTEMCLKAFKHDPLAFLFVPERLKTQELCLEAMKCFGLFLSRVPK
ncbi:MAG: DUF4116 domain-containing protein, partial [Treponema sp.]|nr:DUF4116 domain-containing protein [Treponema sp.]